MARYYDSNGDEVDVSDPAIHYTPSEAKEDRDVIVEFLFSVTSNDE